MDSERDLYQILQIDPAAEQEVVQAAFKRLALKYHPDTNPSPNALRRMQDLNEAYAIISDPVQRSAYDVLRQEKLKARRQAEEQAYYQAAAERRAEAARQRKEQAAAQRRAENERQAKARAAAAQRRVEYEQQIRAQQAAQRRAKHERQQREWEAQQAAQATDAQAAASIEAPVAEPVTEPEAVPEAAPEAAPEAVPEAVPEVQAWVEVEASPIDRPRPSENERRQLALRQSRQALQNEIFKLDYGITDAAEQMKYWNGRRIPWHIDLQTGQDTQFIIGGAVTIFAFIAAGFLLALGGGTGWPVACCLIGVGAGWFTWHTCVSIVPVKYLVEAWTEAKRGRELQRQYLRDELARLEAAIQIGVDDRTIE